MKIIRKTRVCGCCGKKFEGVIPVSYYRNNYGLDNKPENPNDVPFQYVGIAVFLLRREFRKRDVRLLCRRTINLF